MILLSSDYLLFELASGERVPFSADKVCVELMGDESGPFDAVFLEQATKAVFHFFQHELGRDTVTLGEFSGAMEQVLRSFLRDRKRPEEALGAAPMAETDLSRLLAEAGHTELLFFPRLRAELRNQLQASPHLLRFRGLRDCVKQLAGAERWSPRCQDLQERLLDFLRACAAVDRAGKDCALLVE